MVFVRAGVPLRRHNVGNVFFVMVTSSLNGVKDNVGNNLVHHNLEQKQQHLMSIMPILNIVFQM